MSLLLKKKCCCGGCNAAECTDYTNDGCSTPCGFTVSLTGTTACPEPADDTLSVAEVYLNGAAITGTFDANRQRSSPCEWDNLPSNNAYDQLPASTAYATPDGGTTIWPGYGPHVLIRIVSGGFLRIDITYVFDSGSGWAFGTIFSTHLGGPSFGDPITAVEITSANCDQTIDLDNKAESCYSTPATGNPNTLASGGTAAVTPYFS